MKNKKIKISLIILIIFLISLIWLGVLTSEITMVSVGSLHLSKDFFNIKDGGSIALISIGSWLIFIWLSLSIGIFASIIEVFVLDKDTEKKYMNGKYL